MNFWRLGVSGTGLLIVVPSIIAARKPYIGQRERTVFHAINGLPNWLFPLLWLPMQLGNLVVGTAAGLGLAIVDRDITVAIGVVLAMVLKLVTERIIRREMAEYLTVRQRPGTSQENAILRGGDVPKKGSSFPSGHVILVAAIACIVTPNVPLEWKWIPVLMALLVVVGRVYVGAHNPLDVTAGLGTGLLMGGIVATFVN